MERNIYNVRNRTQKIAIWVAFVCFTLYAISLITPFVWVFFNSFKTERDFATNPLVFPPDWHFDNYLKAFTELEINGTNLVGMFANSILLTVIVTVPAVLFPCLTSYAVAKYPCRLTKPIFYIALFMQTIPIVGSFPAFYRLVVALNIKNNFALIWILYASGTGLNFFLFHSFFQGLSWSYAEAAKVDGAGNYRVLFQIMLPQAKAIITALTITSLIGNWNDYMLPFLYMDKYPTVALGIYEYKLLQTYRADRPMLFCGIIMSIVPVLILFACFSKTIMENTSLGGLKG